MILSFIGPSGCGKDTQLDLLKEKYQDIPNISTGKVLRNLYETKTKIGLKAASYWQKGMWVPDDLMMSILQARLSQSDCSNGFILNGFPRTYNQAIQYDIILGEEKPIDHVIFFNLDEETAIQRLSNRRNCPKCGRIYHLIFNPSKLVDLCEDCRVKLVQREDDQPDFVKERLKEFNLSAESIQDYYAKQQKLVKLDASESIAVIHKELLKKLNYV